MQSDFDGTLDSITGVSVRKIMAADADLEKVPVTSVLALAGKCIL